MGREWHWSRPISRAEKDSPGCMSGMLNFFDLHQLLFTTSSSSATGAPPDSPPQEPHPSPQHKGVEAPRNSLELDETAASTSAVGEEYFDVPCGIHLVQVGEPLKDTTMQAGTPRTPNVVARLMGLDLLPDLASSPPVHRQRRPPPKSPSTPPMKTQDRFHKNKKKQYIDECRRGSPPPPPLPHRQPLQPLNCNTLTGSRSLPETPRVSFARSLDADPRPSLQLIKEHSSTRAMQYEFSYLCDYSAPPPPSSHSTKSRKKDFPRDQDENKSPRSHFNAREIVKQVRESITSRRGAAGHEEPVVRSRRTRPAEKNQIKQSEPVKPLLSCSPPSSRLSEPPKSVSYQPTSKYKDHVEAKAIKMGSSPSKKASYERYMERIKRKPSPLKTTVVVEYQLPVSDKKKCIPTPALPAARLKDPSKNFQEQNPMRPVERRHSKDRDPEFRYVKAILEHAGFMSAAVQSVRWYSPSLPIDPIIFHQLEHQLEIELRLSKEAVEGRHWATEEEGELLLGPLRHPWNRKLLFHLVEEILGDLLSTTAHHVGDRERWRGGGESLLRRLCSQIQSFPSADCRVVGDIDALVEGDLPEEKVRRILRHPSVVEEAEDIALEIERNIFDSLVGDAAASLPLLRGSRKLVTSPDVTFGCDR